MPSKLLLRKVDHDKIQKIVKLQGEEDYAVVTHRVHGEWKRSIHVFDRLPTTKEMTDYEDTASRVKFKGQNKAVIEGSQVQASSVLYNKIINRVYDLPLGNRMFGEVNEDGTGRPLNSKEATDRVPSLVKREALRDFIGEVYSESRLAEREGDDEEITVKADSEDE